MKKKRQKPAFSFIAGIFLRTILRFNPFCKPIVPALLTWHFLTILFSILYICDQIQRTFIVEYREITLSAWGFLLLMNFLESLMETIYEKDDER